MHKLPVYLASDRAVVHFVYLVNDDNGHGLAQFLHDHVRLFSALQAWSIVAVCPRGLHGLPACQTVFDRLAATTWRPVTVEGLDDVRWFFAARQLVERRDLRTFSVADLDRFRETRQRFATAQIEALYGAWLAHGERAFDHGNGRASDMSAPAPQLVLQELPSTYSQFGSFPGVC